MISAAASRAPRRPPRRAEIRRRATPNSGAAGRAAKSVVDATVGTWMVEWR
jgi:hypothetical protein